MHDTNDRSDVPSADSQGDSRGIWFRVLYMVLFAIIYSVAEVVVWTVVVLQLAHRLFTGRLQAGLLSFGGQLSRFVYQIWRYLTFNSEHLPWPFGSWPKDESELKQ